MKTKNSMIALSVTLALAASHGAWAKEKDWEYHEDKWGQVISYAKTPISNDSASEWGPWSEFMEPAAGPAAPFIGEAEGDLYRPYHTPLTPPPSGTPETPFPPAVDTCPAGMACGYAIYKNFSSGSYGGYGYDSSCGQYGRCGEHGSGNNGGYNGYYPATFTANAAFGDPGPWGPWGMFGQKGSLDGSFGLAKLNGSDGPDPLFNASGDLSGHYYLPNSSWSWLFGPPNGNASRNDSSGGANIDGKLTTAADGQTANGAFKIYAYMNGMGWSECWSGCGGSSEGVTGYYIAGYPTLAAYMDTLRAGNVSATYTGNEILGGGGVVIDVQFGPATWEGTWSGPNFKAAGTVTGANIQSTSFLTGATGGQVKGTFYGTTAQALAGVSDVNLNNGTRHVDLFATQKVTP